MSKKIWLLVDYINHFYSSVRRKGASMDIQSLGKHFAKLGYDMVVMAFSDVDFRNQNYKGQYVFYQSSEDRDLFYKSFIEDVVLGLRLQEAILIPDFYLFRAHHNKVFMEILRDLNPNSRIKNIYGKGYGTFEEYRGDSSRYAEPIVLKPAEGAMSRNIEMFPNGQAGLAHAERLTRSIHAVDALKNSVKSFVRKSYYTKRSNHRKKLIVQNFISRIDHDYKILVYGERYYVLLRKNRPDDFRASGSGLFERVEDLPDGLLDFAESVFNSFRTPYISIDVGTNGTDFFLFEFQFVHFGTATIEGSAFCFMRDCGKWTKVYERPDLEAQVARSVVHYINSL